MSGSIRRTLLTTLLTLSSATAAPAHTKLPDLDTLTVADAARLVRSGRVSAEALVRASLARIKALSALNAVVTLNEERAVAAAKAVDEARRQGLSLGPLAGVPLVIKDNIHVAGLPNTAGTPGLKGFVPSQHAPVVAKLIDAGAIVVAKTSMHELAFGISGYNPAFNTGPEPGIRNAYDKARIAGGSSSGTGALVGARAVPGGLGTDTGGSVRIPCAVNGCAALRPTVGRYAQAGITPISHTRDTAGPMAQTVGDLELIDSVISGRRSVAPANLSTVRLGLFRGFLKNADEETQAAFEKALDRARKAGVTIVEVDMPRLAELNGLVSFPVAIYEAYDDVAAYLKQNGIGKTVEDITETIASPDVKGTYAGLVVPRKLPGPDNTVVDAKPAYEAAIRQHRPALIAHYTETFARHKIDALVFPTVPKVAIAASPDASSLSNFLLFIQNTDPGSNAGLPGLTLPIGRGSASGLPIGLELDGPAGSDARLLAIGMSLEKVYGRLAPPKR
ncbi:MAG: indoleacetamide hydrolase [Hyphomonadaceae bacterium]|nr:indoleacetamide hydrolase [Hyphomonadaceae bacterium]